MKRILAGCMLLGLCAAPATAHAEDTWAASGMGLRPKESPQNWAVEFRFSPYRPAIDDEPSLNGATPYKNVFGTMPRLLLQLEVDWQVLRVPHVGTIGPGIAVGYTNMSARARVAATGAPSEQDTSIEIFPAYAVAVLRGDAILRELRFPIVPYGKLGIGAARWRVYGPLGTSSASGATGRGTTYGMHYALGATLSLNFLDKAATLNLDNGVGINQTHLFFEYYVSHLTGIGQDHPLYVGTSTWATGLAFEF